MGTRYDHLPAAEAQRRAEADAASALALEEPPPSECRGCGWSPPAGESTPDRCPKCGSGAVAPVRPDPNPLARGTPATAGEASHERRDPGKESTMAKPCANPRSNPNCAGTVGPQSKTGLCRSCGQLEAKARRKKGGGRGGRRGGPRRAADTPSPAPAPATGDFVPATLEVRPDLPAGPRSALAHGVAAVLAHLDAGGTLDADLHVEPGKVHFGLDLEAGDG